ncbi:MAG: 50S ribosomal protein L24 [Candidatus Woesearchaeota archaeon]
MEKEWNKGWRRSIQPRKQHKYVYNAPLHIRQKLMGAHLSKDLASKYGIKTLPVKKGDTVKVMRGQFKKKVGKVTGMQLKKGCVRIEGVEQVKKDGTKALYPIKPSNIMITELNIDDRKRKKIIDRRNVKKNG